ncbi:MAG: MAPEG family protein [Betaproteobacteria bacterium]|jgi:hypothetical protein|nr:hypothetical protein AEM42_09605 [Betaproteobacteria bacterium UKL13-2]HCG53863.1 hypothetical protein [Betaproteobacteria bacterium]
MRSSLILYPLLAMVLITFVVAVTMMKRRLTFLTSERIHPQQVATAAKMASVGEDPRAADNFRNLFEMPVLFYAAVLTIFVAKLISPLLLALAWVYVLTRGAHSLIHCTFNKVIWRFYAFFASCLVLAVLWLAIAYQLVVA